ncbi:MAG: hypothetical protein Q8R01_02080 [Ramlibacter sp.]|nr:hypothetical protein [Ramlibacter sp.]
MLRDSSFLCRCLLALLGALLALAMGAAQAGTQASGGAALRSRFAATQPLLVDSPFGGPLVLESTEAPRLLQGDVYALVDHPFAAVSAALANPDRWCDVMILHLNTKHCRRGVEDGVPQIELRVGKKHDQPVAAASLVAFGFRAVSATPEYLAVELQAPQGPFDTHDYRILFEAIPAEGGRSFIHMGYSFGYGAISRMAMQVYLSTIARDKVGFTTTARTQPGEPPAYIGGIRGLVERNTMRYYLAIDAYLGAASAPPAQQMEKRLRAWFDATEKYARQLHEVDRDEYLAMKRREHARQQQPQ